MIEAKTPIPETKPKALAFRTEFYEGAGDNQIRDDIVSYLAEYRFEVPEYEYKLGIANGELVDPNTNESMTKKAQKAINTRKIHGLKTIREEAEFEGLCSLEEQLKVNSKGTVVWLSPPGEEKDGYGKYGFAYVGHKKENFLEMTAIRLEEPKIPDFNLVAYAMWGKTLEFSAEDFLRNPKVLDIDKERAKEFIHGVFEVRGKESRTVFENALSHMEGLIEKSKKVIKYGTKTERQQAINVLENVAIELKNRFAGRDRSIVYLSGYRNLSLDDALKLQKYVRTPPPVSGSCGMTGKVESSNIFRLLDNSSIDTASDNSREWFTCPKCNYKADGPIGDKCPGCGLTKEEYAKKGGEVC